MKRILPLLLVSTFLGWQPILAQTVPPLMNYQGRLTDEAGAPLPDGTYRLAFRLYTNAVPVVEEHLIWGREYEASLLGGFFNVVLGAAGGGAVQESAAVNDLTFAFTEPNRFLELRIVRDAAGSGQPRTILPRQQLLSAPYVMQAENAARLGGISAQDYPWTIINLVYPVGSFYLQFPDANSNNETIAFPASRRPAELFGGTWEEQWPTESIYFRTGGPRSEESRVNGFQDYATKRLTGYTPHFQIDYNRRTGDAGADGVFSNAPNSTFGATDGGHGNDRTARGFFDSDRQSLSSSTETRSRTE